MSQMIQPGRTAAAAAVVRTPSGKLTLTHPTRGYAVTRNPFAIAAILPLVVATFIGLDIAVLLNVDPVVMSGAFIVMVCGWMLIPAVALRGSLNLTHDGITFERGKDFLTADWAHVSGLSYKSDCGLCVTFEGATQSRPDIKLPGGFRATNGAVQIPLRMFGDRQYSILYDVRDQIPPARWREAIDLANKWSTTKSQVVYAGVVGISCVAMLIVMWIYTH